MKIETRFNIGDEVWLLSKSFTTSFCPVCRAPDTLTKYTPKQEKIIKVECRWSETGTLETYYLEPSRTWYDSEVLHATEAEAQTKYDELNVKLKETQ